MERIFYCNEAQCERCGICSQVCLASIISPDPETGIPSVRSENNEYCTACGHCESFCPRGAVRMDYPGAVPFPGDPQVRKISPDLVRYLLASRRTIRQFKNTPISHDVLVELLDNARYAPSGFNLHPVQWMIAEDRGVIERLSSLTVEWLKSLDSGAVPDEYAPLLPVIPKIIDNWESGRDPVCYHAPALVIAHADQKISSAGYDALIALSYLDLIAPVFQLGTCWAGLLQMAISTSPRISAVLPLPQGHITHHILLIGKPRYDVYQIPKRAPPVISFV